MTRLQFSAVLVLVLSACAASQLTIDATGPLRERKREPTTSSGGGVGRKLPVHVGIATIEAAQDDKGMTEVQFTLTNSGKAALEIPISPHPGDFEPQHSNTAYSVEVLSLYVTSDSGKGVNRHEAMLAGGAHLYGSDAVPGSLVLLGPGESINVLTRVALPLDSNEGSTTILVAHISLSNEKVRGYGERTSSDLREIGSADSQDYPARFLFTHRE